jgi:hypothetical protein
MKLVHPVIFLLAGEGHRLCVADTSPAHFWAWQFPATFK